MSSLTGEVDKTLLNRKILLVKIPTVLLKEIEGNCSNNQKKDSILLPSGSSFKQTNENGRLLVHDEAGRVNESQIKWLPEKPSMVAFSQLKEDEKGRVVLEGTIERQGIIQASTRRGVQQSQDNKRSSRITNFLDEESSLLAHQDGLRPVRTLRLTEEAEERKRRKVESRRVIDAGDTDWKERSMLRLFQLFERKSYWTLRELNNELQLPGSRLKSIMNEICHCHRSGPFKGQYELKDEFKTKQQRDEKAADEAARIAEQQNSAAPGSVGDLRKLHRSGNV
eukprot:jgi/Galph1/3448/GphlegSOOS_G2075.1